MDPLSFRRFLFFVVVAFFLKKTAFAASIAPSIGASVSYGSASLSEADSASMDTSGSQTQFMGQMTFQLPNWSLDAGLGFLTTSISGRSAASASPSSSLSLDRYDLTTNAGVAELCPQYRFTDRLQAGPLAELLFGQDVGFMPGFGYSGQTTAWLGGAQALYALSASRGAIDFRAGLRYLRSLDLEDRTLSSVQATVQIGLPL